MSRRSDLDLAWTARSMMKAVEAAYDLGRAAQAEKDAPKMGFFTETDKAKDTAKRLRARVKKIVEGEK